ASSTRTRRGAPDFTGSHGMLAGLRHAIWCAPALTASVQAGTIYVDASASGGGTGASWALAFRDLQSALAIAAAGDEGDVARGLYRPAPAGGARGATFSIPSGVAVRGGYSGLAGPDPDQRDIVAFVTTLSGDLNGDSTASFANENDNSFHVVTILSGSSS